MVITSATTTHALYHDRHHHRMPAADRADAHPLRRSTQALLDGMTGENIALLNDLLRMDAVRGVLQHYHGRRYAGTKRTLAMARGTEM